METKFIKTYGEIHPSWMIELVADASHSERLKLLFFDGSQERIQNDVVCTHPESSEKLHYLPADLDASVLRAIHFPADATGFGSTRELFDAICSLVKKFTNLSDQYVSLVSYAILASWMVEFTNIPICLAIVGAPSAERRQLLRLLRCLFRRSLLMSEVSLAGLCTLPMELTPSLLIERCEPGAALEKFLHVTSSPGAHIASKGQLLNVCCAKVICVDESLTSFDSDCPVVEIPLQRSTSPPPVLDELTQHQIAAEFQPKLLKYRLTNYMRVREFRWDAPDLDTPMRELAHCLAAAVAGDPELQSNAMLLVKKEIAQPHLASQKLFRAMVIRALLSFCHGAENASAAEISREASKILAARGENLTLEPRAVGNVLRSIRLSPERLGARGRGIILLKSIRERIHAIAQDYGLTLMDPGNCNICFAADPQNRSPDASGP